MKVQSLSITVPTKGCINNCKFCCSEMHDDNYVTSETYIYKKKAIEKRIKYAIIHNVDTLILTSSSGEVLQNMRYLEMLHEILQSLNNFIPRIEIQTTGVLLNDEKMLFLKEMGVTTISLSVSDLFNDNRNMEIIGVPKKEHFLLKNITDLIHSYDMNIRLSLNMTSAAYPDFIFEDKNISYKLFKLFDSFFERAKELNSNQVTFRKMYLSNNKTKEDEWVNNNMLSDEFYTLLNDYIVKYGNKLYRLPFGGIVYSVNGVSTVLDDDCMSKEYSDDILKYLILRENNKLYMKWDDVGSIIF